MTARITVFFILVSMATLVDAGLALVGNENGGTISLIDTARDEGVGEIKTGGQPRRMAIHAARQLAYVSDQPNNAPPGIDPPKLVRAKQNDPGGSPDGAKAYVACERADTVYVLDARQHRILGTIKAGARSNGLAMHPDGKRLYVTNGGDGNVIVIDTAADKVVATIPVGQRPWNMALTRDGAKLYVANGRSDSVSVIDTAKNARIKDIPVGKTPWGVSIFE